MQRWLAILPIALLCCGFCFGVVYEQRESQRQRLTEPMPKQEAIKFLEHCINAHQYYAERPGECSQVTGDAEWNWELVGKYERIIALVKDGD